MFVLPLQAEELERLKDREAAYFTATASRQSLPPGRGNRIALIVSQIPGSTPRRRLGHVVALGLARPDGFASTLDRRVRISKFTMLESRVPVSSFRTELTDFQYGALRAAATSRGGEGLTRAVSLATARALRAILGDPLIDQIEAADNRTVFSADTGARWQQESDAVRLVLRAAGLDSKLLNAWSEPDDEAPFLAGLLAVPSEASLIDHDARRLPGWEALEDVRPDIRVFTDGTRRIEILSANATGVEARTGVDLIYYQFDARSLVFVQYKKLKEGRARVDDRMRNQLVRMHAVTELNRIASSPSDYRVGQRASCFVKLASAGTFDASADRLMAGMYLPLDYLDLLLADDGVRGPRGGQSIGWDNVGRFMDNTMFVKLLAEGWIGSTGVTMEDVMRLGADSLAERRSLVLAVNSASSREPFSRT